MFTINHRLCSDSTNNLLLRFSGQRKVFYLVFKRPEDVWFSRWKHFPQTSVAHSQRAARVIWLVEMSPYWIYVCVLERESRRARMKYFVWLRRFMHEQNPPGPLHSIGPAPHVMTPLWPSSLLTSLSAFSHQRNDAASMASETVLIRPLPPYSI